MGGRGLGEEEMSEQRIVRMERNSVVGMFSFMICNRSTARNCSAAGTATITDIRSLGHNFQPLPHAQAYPINPTVGG